MMRASDIALALSAAAANQLRATCAGVVWVKTITGSPYELMQAGLVDAKNDFMSGAGFNLLPTNKGREVAKILTEQAQ